MAIMPSGRLLQPRFPVSFAGRWVIVGTFLCVNLLLTGGILAWRRPTPALMWPTTSADGTRLAWQASDGQGHSPLDGAEVWTADVQHGQLRHARRLAVGYRPLLSPNGRSLVFWRLGPDAGLYRSEGTTVQRISTAAIDAGYRTRPTLQPLGSPVAFHESAVLVIVRDGRQQFGLDWIPLVGPTERWLTAPPDYWLSDLHVTAEEVSVDLRHRGDQPQRLSRTRGGRWTVAGTHP